VLHRRRGTQGSVITTTRQVASFERLAVSNSIDVHLRIGRPISLELTGEQDALAHVTTIVENRRLTIAMDRTGSNTRSIHAELTVPSLADIDVTTAGRVAAEGLAANSLTIRAESGGVVAASGVVDRLEVVATSSSRVDLTELRASAAQVDAGSSASVEVNVTRAVSGSVHESASVEIYGHPAVLDVTQATSGRVVESG
jgi:hypothetical protein